MHEEPSTLPLRRLLPAAAVLVAGVAIGVSGSRLASAKSAGDNPFDASARADLVSQVGGLTVLTSDAGGDDVLLVLDSRNEELFVYKTTNNNGIQLAQRYSVPQLFIDARARALGAP
jgi:hypothetical protein